MIVLADPQGLLAEGLAAIRTQYEVPGSFPPDVLAEAAAAASQPHAGREDWTDRPFVTLDPASSTDLDQAFFIEARGEGFLLHYALADVGAFVARGSATEAEAFRRGVTLYLPDGQARLYPPALSEAAASLLPDGPRPAVVVSIACSADGVVRLEGAVRAMVKSRAKLAYDSVDTATLPHLDAFAAAMRRGEAARGAIRIERPDQELERGDDGQFALALRAWLPSERINAQLSLAANVAIAEALLAAGRGLFREMPAPDAEAVAALRRIAAGLDLVWPENATLTQFERLLDWRSPATARFAEALRQRTGFAHYAPYRAGHVPWHAALGATYTHATAPMRRLADRYILDAVVALVAGEAPAPGEAALFAQLAEVMAAADAREGAIERAVLDLAEATLLHGREGELFAAIVSERDARGAMVQLRDLPVLARIEGGALAPGDAVTVRLEAAEPANRLIRLALVD